MEGKQIAAEHRRPELWQKCFLFIALWSVILCTIAPLAHLKFRAGTIFILTGTDGSGFDQGWSRFRAKSCSQYNVVLGNWYWYLGTDPEYWMYSESFFDW
ncbi:MAG: hypothetical protein JWN70_4262 [Planctomycetaceae bacterium]|nr:hypothetical protein [Planctomycetaceae bacterium]